MRTWQIGGIALAAMLFCGCSLDGVIENFDDTPKCSSYLARSSLEDLVLKNVFHLDENESKLYSFKYEYVYNTKYDPLSHRRDCVAQVVIKKAKKAAQEYQLNYSLAQDEISGQYLVILDTQSIQKQMDQDFYQEIYRNILRNILINKKKD